MQVDEVAGEHDDFDTSSLFGSPPPSPGRGRSPSPLALPGGQNDTQNVGTLALPGSHLCSEFYELPSAPSPPPCVPAKRSVTNQLQPQLPPSRAASATPRSGTPALRSTTSSRKHKRASRRSTPDVRPTPPPITLPSPTEPPPANFLRNQQALLGLAGLVSGVNPANLSVQRHTRGESPSNPIVVEDVPDTPTIGRQPAYVSGPLPVPSPQEVLSTLVRQKNLYVVVDALVRLVNNAAGTSVIPVPYPPVAPRLVPSSSQPHTHGYLPAYYPYPAYQYGYPYTYPYPYSYAPSYPHASYQQYAFPYQPPPPKKRKLTDVPAGAADWDVPYPFPAGQGPRDYHSNWAQQRQQQLLDDLVGLLKSATRKAAAKKAKDEAESEAAIGSVEYYKERFLRHCRPPSSTPASVSVPARPVEVNGDEAEPLKNTRNSTPPPSSPHLIPEQLEVVDVPEASTSSCMPLTEEKPDSNARPQEPLSDTIQENSTVVDDLTPKTPKPASADPQPTAFPPISPEASAGGAPNNHVSDLDELLALLNDIPPTDLDAIFAPSEPEGSNQPSSSTSASASEPSPTGTSSEIPAIDPLMFAIDPSLLAIDPALLAISFPLASSDPQQGASEADKTDSSSRFPSSAVSFAASAGSPTPPLAGSPMSLAELDPPTPSWDFSFPEPEIAVAGGDGELTNGTGDVVLDHGDEDVQRKDKGKGRAKEEDFMDVQQDRSMSLFMTGTSTPAHPGERIAVTPVSTPRPTPMTSANQSYHHSSPLPFLANKSSFKLPPAPSPFLARLSSANKSSHSSIQGKNKEDIIRRARLMRAQIVEELERAKVELWETRMEGGCLAVLAKERDKLS